MLAGERRQYVGNKAKGRILKQWFQENIQARD